MTEQARGVPTYDPSKPEDWMIEPLDYMILDKMMDEGTNVGGLYQIGETAKGIRKSLGNDNISMGSLATRIRILGMAGYSRKVKMVGSAGATAYQRTVRGKEVLEAWRKRQAPAA